MIELYWPWALIMAPLPWIVRRILSPLSEPDIAALRLPFYSELMQDAVQSPVWHKKIIMVLAILAWLAVLLAAARPQWIGEPILLPVKGRDLMLAVDISGSMKTADMRYKGQNLTRLQGVKAVATEFIERREGDRLGLILFGKQAYLQTPLTFDRKTIQILLGEAAIGLAGKETAIGDAIGLTVKRLRDLDRESRILILLTDGANTAGVIDPIKAGELAGQEGVKIYTIGIGADEMSVPGLFGSRTVNPSADLDEKTLKTLARETGGQYFRARNLEELEKIYQLLDELEPREKEQNSYRPIEEWFWWPLSFAMLIAGLLLLIQTWQRRGSS